MSGTAQTLDREPASLSLEAAEPFPWEDFGDCAQQAVPAGRDRERVEVTIELGSTTLCSAELDAIGAGSVVRLDERAADPVNVYAGGRLVARGELVVLGGRVSVRVTEVHAIPEDFED